MMPAPAEPTRLDGAPQGRPDWRARLQALPGRSRLLGALALLPALAFALMAAAPPLNHDVAAILNFAERWVAGEALYAELIDVNPPLIFVLAAIPAGLAALAGLPAIPVWLGFVAAALLLAWHWTARLRDLAAEGPVARAVLDAAIPFTLVLAAYDVGQREHLMALFAIPYAFLAARRAEARATPRALAFGVTLAAALGFALKPHFLAVPVLVEALVLAWRGRAAWRDPLPWTMAAVWLAYLASLPALFPAYLDTVLPLMGDYYLDNHGFGWFDVLLGPLLGGAAAMLVATLALLVWPGAGTRAWMLGAVGLGALASAWVQHKGWSYHIAPIAMASALLAVEVIGRWLDTALPPARARRNATLLALALVSGLATLHLRGESPWRQIWYWQLRDGQLALALKREVAGERLLVLSPDIYPVYPALPYARARSTLRTMNSWMLVGAYAACPEGSARYRETWDMARPEFFIYRTVAEDFARAPPAGVLVANDQGIPRCGDAAFDPIAYFGRHPAFAETWRRYTRVVILDTYRLFLPED
jgi:hypothetical protein